MRRLLPLLCGLLLAACGQRAARPIGDFTLPVYTPRYASGFEITGAAGSRSTLVTVHNPWYGDEVTDQYLFIARDGEPAPAGFEGQVLRDEARRVVCMSGSYIAMLDALGAANRVVGVSGAQYLINETLRRRIARGEAADVGFDSNVDFERLMALRPDLVMLYGIGGADTALTGKLRELGIPYLYMGEHCEESPLGKSEWVVVAAEIARVSPNAIIADQDEIPGTLFAYHCDDPDLPVVSYRGIPVTREHLTELEASYLDLQALVFDARSATPYAEAPFAFAFALCDSTGSAHRAGISHAFIPNGKADDE